MKTIQTREAWLLQAIDLSKPLFESFNYKVPKIHVTCGWPSSRGLSAKKRAIGECWAASASKDGISQIFISPYLDEVDTEQGVLATLVHEIVHAVVGIKEKHNKVFGKCARAVGLEGKLTSTVAGKVLLARFEAWLTKLGTYPHSKLDSCKSPTKKQTTRLIKAECIVCGYNVRVTRKWLEKVGAPICPHNKKFMKFEIPDELESEDDGE